MICYIDMLQKFDRMTYYIDIFQKVDKMTCYIDMFLKVHKMTYYIEYNENCNIIIIEYITFFSLIKLNIKEI